MLTLEQVQKLSLWIPAILDYESVPEIESDPSILDPYDFWPHCAEIGKKALGASETSGAFIVAPPRIYADVRRFGRKFIEANDIVVDVPLLKLGYGMYWRAFDLPIFIGGNEASDEASDRFFFLCPSEGPVDPSRAVRMVYHPLTEEGLERRLAANRGSVRSWRTRGPL